MITCTDLSKYLDSSGTVKYLTDGYGRVLALVEGDITLQGVTDEPMPYLIEVIGQISVGPFSNKCPHIKANRIDLTNATVSTLSQSELLAKDRILINKSRFAHLTKRTRRCNQFCFI